MLELLVSSVTPEPPYGWDEVPDHPGQQCHDAHPDRPHRRQAQAPPDYEAILRPTAPGAVFREAMTAPVTFEPAPAATVDQATALVLLGSDPWTRFDTWADRAWELAERAIEAATAEGERNQQATLTSETIYDPRAATLLDAARMCADLAQAVCPLSALAGLPGRLPEIELDLPPGFR